MQRGNKEEVASGRRPARAEEDRDTGQRTSGVVKTFLSFSCYCQEAAKRSTTPNDSRGRRDTFAKLGRSSKGAQFSLGVGRQDRDGSYTWSGRGGDGSSTGSRMSPARESRVVLRRQAG